VRFGMFVLPRYYADAWDSIGQYYQHLLQLMVDGEQLGFTSAWVNEHHFHAYGGLMAAPPVFLAALATRTSTIRLGTSVALLSLHHPLEQAEAYAMLDQLSGGRLDFGVGRGTVRSDYQSLGVPWDEAQERMLENIAIVLQAWQRQPFSYRGRFCRVDDVAVWPPPLQSPHPPIWGSATRNPASFAWCGSQGYQLLTIVHYQPLDQLAALMQTYREAAVASGYDLATRRISTHFHVYCAESRAEAYRDGAWAMQRDSEQTIAAHAQVDHTRVDIRRDPLEEMVASGRLCVGTPDECAAILAHARDTLGLTDVICAFDFGGLGAARVRRSFELFAREVLPRFEAAAVVP
jgi:alkanesulfonate monooxygenase SsuD/methylene tetrahydromethanopterin reductase-like flavin-dependent oxidoreductase (luciferase family)